jgi:hypothetical protein
LRPRESESGAGLHERKASGADKRAARSATLLLGWLVPVAAAFLFFLFTTHASATVLPTAITENTTLTPAGSPYTGSSTIEPGVTLKVEPGVHLTVGGLTVKGALKAEGTAENPVRFTGIKEETWGEWRSIVFKAGSGASILNHVELVNGGSRDAGYLNCNNGAANVEEGASPTIENSTIRLACGYGIKVSGGGAPEIANNVFIKSGGSGEAINYVA